MENTLVSVVVITYNQEDTIGDAIDGILMQKTNFKYEIIIHDDASTDKTPEIIENYRKKYPDIIIPILRSENLYSKSGFAGISVSFYKMIKGKYIALCEGDDYWTDPNKLQMQIDFMESTPQCSFCLTAAHMVSYDKSLICEIHPYNADKMIDTRQLYVCDNHIYPTASFVFKAKLYCDLMELMPDFYSKSPIGDGPLQAFCSINGYLYYIDKITCAYRKGQKNSYNNTLASSPDSKERYRKIRTGIIESTKEFNKFTNYEFDDCIQEFISFREFRIIEDDADYAKLRTGRYYKYFKQLPLKRRLHYDIIIYFPHTYKFFKKVFRK